MKKKYVSPNIEIYKENNELFEAPTLLASSINVDITTDNEGVITGGSEDGGNPWGEIWCD